MNAVLCSLLVMTASAKPPEPMRELLPQAELVVVAEVVAVRSTEAPDGTNLAPLQVVVLRVQRALRGDVQVAAELVVQKPRGEYALSLGNRGAFLLRVAKAAPIKDGGSVYVVLGRYGPDNYRVVDVEAALLAR